MKIGVRFSQTDGFSSKIIRWFTRSQWSHVDLVMPDGSLLGALPFKGVVQRKEDKNKGETKTLYVRVPDEMANLVFNFAEEQLGKKYDWIAIYGFVGRHDWQREGKWFCSELVFASIKKSGVELLHGKKWRISPRDLYLSPILSGG